MTNKIHPTSIIEDSVKLGKNIDIGPFCYISGQVKIGDNCKLISHISIKGQTIIGKNNKFYPFSNIGEVPQDLKFEDEESKTEIGDNNIFREHVTVHSGTSLGNKYYSDKNITKIGSNSLFMVGSHIAHDCIVEDNVILANNATLAGHVYVGSNVIIGGLSAIHQFVKIGDFSIIGGMSGVENDVIPYALVVGERANLGGVNLIGLKRKNFSREEISKIKKTYDILFENSKQQFFDKLKIVNKEFPNDKIVKKITDFIEHSRNKPICKPKSYKH